MFEHQLAIIQVQDCYLEGANPNMDEHECEILSCEPTENEMRLLLHEEDLMVISLDSIYLCKIECEDEPLYCRIDFYKRFLNKLGPVLCARIREGFTKKI